MTSRPTRYRSREEDSARWLEFEFRDDDIVISTRSKSGTTWVQMICALLIFRTPDLPRPLPQLSPWLDWLVLPQDELFADLAAQRHRRFIKTHTPLDGVPDDDRVTYIVVARHPLDAAVSLYHQSNNLDRERIARLTGNPSPATPRHLPPLSEWLLDWTESDVEAADDLDSFNGVFHHLTDAWNRKDDPNVVLVHYADLLHDLPGEMRRLAIELGIEITDVSIDALARAATLDAMRSHADEVAPDPAGVLLDRSRFFRTGGSGAGTDALSPAGLAAYRARAADAAPPDLRRWLHRG
ncbi:sulfotransferase domain-containing protein [Ilumatobacter nonamiensis]|uniref:sulfotransferase domain-containing protein n=1 Tax=Ilumatobacter nonamiensis TaxID=467093 RepID=UPI00034B362E|nr:sulfotransferase domain-containing protein [Ilumatobacter nonamiensis]